MGTTDSKELVKNDPRFDYNNTDNKNQNFKEPGKYTEEEEKSYIKTQTSNEEDGKYDQYGTPGKSQSNRHQVFSEMTRRVLKNKESFSSAKGNSFLGRSQGGRNARNIDTDGIEWVKKEEIIDHRLVSTTPYGTKAPRDKLFGPGSKKNRVLKARSGVLTYLPPKALATILSFDMGSYRKYMSICASWHVTIKEALDQHFNRVENEFVLKYHQNLLFTESFTSSSEIKF